MRTKFPYTLRILVSRPLFALAAIAVVALGVAIASTTATTIYALLHKPIPVSDIHQLYRIQSGMYDGSHPPANTRDIMDHLKADAFTYFHSYSVELYSESLSDLVTVSELQGQAFDILAWRPLHGRLLQGNDLLRGSERVALVSHAYWKSSLGGSQDAIGSSVNLNGKPFQIVGILPPMANRVLRTTEPDFWIAFAHTFEDWRYDHRTQHSQTLIARVKDAEELAQLRSQIEQAEKYLKDSYPESNYSLDLSAIPETQAEYRNHKDAAKQSYIILGLVAVLLAITCLNLGNMLLSDAYRRKRDFAIRRSIGASAQQIAKHLLAESLLISLIGGIVSIALAHFLLKLANGLPFARWIEIEFEPFTFFAACGATLLTGIASGLIPALHFSRGTVNNTLHQGAKGSRYSVSSRVILVAQVAFSFVLICSFALYFSSLASSLRFDPGFKTDRLVYFSVSLQSVDPNTRESVAQSFRDRIENLPGVESAAWATARPLGGFGSTRIKTSVFDPSEEADACFSYRDYVSAGFPETLGVDFISGRDIRDEEAGWPYLTAAVNEAFQRRYWPDSSAVGQEFYPYGGSGEEPARVVGVFRDFTNTPWEDPRPLLLIAHSTARTRMWVRTAESPKSILSTLQALTRDPTSPVVCGEIEFYEDAQKLAFRNENSALMILGALGLVAISLSVAGIWYSTRVFIRQSQKELAIRLALGAMPSSILRFALRRSLTLAAIGIAIGALLSLLVGYLIQSAIQGIHYLNPAPYFATALLFAAISLLAAYLPARSALTAHPRDTLTEV